MKRYKALALRTVDMGFIEPHLTNEWGTYDVCLATDVAELQDRYREAVELLRSALSMTTDRLEEHMDDWIEWEDSTDAFLAEEEEA